MATKAAKDGSESNKRRRITASSVLDLLMGNPEALKVVFGHHSFLTTAELGRLLLLTSKRLTEAIVGQNPHDEIFKCLCVNQWGRNDATTLIEQTGWSAEQCFRTICVDDGSTQHPAPDLQPLRYSRKDYLFIVELRDEENSLSRCITIRGEEIPDFFDTGEAQVTFEEPLWTGKEYTDLNYDSKIDIMRLVDKGCVRIGAERVWVNVHFSEHKGKQEKCEPIDIAYDHVRESPPLSVYGSWLMDKYFPEYARFCVSAKPMYRFVDDDCKVVGMFGVHLCAMLGDVDGDDFLELDISLRQSLEEGEGDVKFSHFLEALCGFSKR